ncbi:MULTISPECIES: hypothetical protein [Streptomyces]|uniref:hypothetical protein n=1 Tax=Streptomyces TaxID=1883 RepID=UPI00031F4049|nr:MULTISPECIES: hypothetical protein [Streptomyces]MYS66130.1 hypothetical protein [Streptomyces sp. SID5473]
MLRTVLVRAVAAATLSLAASAVHLSSAQAGNGPPSDTVSDAKPNDNMIWG